MALLLVATTPRCAHRGRLLLLLRVPSPLLLLRAALIHIAAAACMALALCHLFLRCS